MAPGRAHGPRLQRPSPGSGQDVQGRRVPGEPGGHRMAGRLGRVDTAGGQGPECGLVQPCPDGRGQLVHGLPDEFMPEFGPALTGVQAQPGSGERFFAVATSAAASPATWAATSGRKRRAQHRGGPQICCTGSTRPAR